MIKFFRKIRQKLLSENKAVEYLKYALGEIILVVIGILIALQINTWNNKRIANIEMKSYLQSIKEDLITDTTEFNIYINFYKRILANKKKLLSLTQFDNISNDSLADLITPHGATNTLTTTTFNKITNLGITDISNNDSLSRKIYDYYTIQLEIFNTFINWDNDHTTIESNYWFYGQDMYEFKFSNEFPQVQDENTNRQNLIGLITEPKGRNYLIHDYERKKIVLLRYQNMKGIADELIMGIEKELNNN